MQLQTSIISQPLFNPRTDQEGVKEILRTRPDLRGSKKLMELWKEFKRLTGKDIKFTSLERYSREFSNS